MIKYKIKGKGIYWNFWIPGQYFSEGIGLFHINYHTGYFPNGYVLKIKYNDQINKKSVSDILGVFEKFKIRKHLFSKDKTIYLYNFVSSFSKCDVEELLNQLQFIE